MQKETPQPARRRRRALDWPTAILIAIVAAAATYVFWRDGAGALARRGVGRCRAIRTDAAECAGRLFDRGAGDRAAPARHDQPMGRQGFRYQGHPDFGRRRYHRAGRPLHDLSDRRGLPRHGRGCRGRGDAYHELDHHRPQSRAGLGNAVPRFRFRAVALAGGLAARDPCGPRGSRDRAPLAGEGES